MCTFALSLLPFSMGAGSSSASIQWRIEYSSESARAGDSCQHHSCQVETAKTLTLLWRDPNAAGYLFSAGGWKRLLVLAFEFLFLQRCPWECSLEHAGSTNVAIAAASLFVALVVGCACGNALIVLHGVPSRNMTRGRRTCGFAKRCQSPRGLLARGPSGARSQRCPGFRALPRW